MPVRGVCRRMGMVAASVFAWTIVTGVAWAGPPWGTDEPSFQSMYLQPGDLPNPVEKAGDWAGPGCDGPSAGKGCSFSGKKLWRARDPNSTVGEVHDIRYVFPDAASAQRFMQDPAGARELTENLQPVAQPPAVGSDTNMYTMQGDALGLGIEMYMYNLVFRVDNIVVKIFVAQGATVKGKVLSPLMIGAIGQKAVDRIRAAEPSRTPVGAPPVAPTPVEPTPPQPQPQPEPQPIAAPEPPPEPHVEPTPEPPPRPKREPGRLASDVREYWRSGIRKPYIFVGGDYSRALGSFKLPGGTALQQKNAFDISLGMLVHPRAYFQIMFHREVWQVPQQQELLVRRLELIYGLDILALPPSWRLRPALMALLGFGVGWGRTESLVSSTPDPLDPMPIAPVEERKGIGIGGVFGGEFALHLRITPKFEIAPFGGITVPGYTYTNDFPAADRRIEGERGFGRAWRWHVGLRIGFEGPK